MLILLIEDDAMVAEMLYDALSEADYEVHVVATLEAAKDEDDDNCFDAVVTDLQIPRFLHELPRAEHGLAVVEKFAKKGVPVIVASFSPDHFAEARELGARAVIGKAPGAVLAALGALSDGEAT